MSAILLGTYAAVRLESRHLAGRESDRGIVITGLFIIAEYVPRATARRKANTSTGCSFMLSNRDLGERGIENEAEGSSVFTKIESEVSALQTSETTSKLLLLTRSDEKFHSESPTLPIGLPNLKFVGK